MKRSILKNSLKSLYADSEEILEAFDLVDFSQLDTKFYSEMFEHIDEELFWKIDSYLQSDEVMCYYQAVDRAALACTQDLANLIELAMVEKDVKH
jgi:hypothetical protein